MLAQSRIQRGPQSEATATVQSDVIGMHKGDGGGAAKSQHWQEAKGARHQRATGNPTLSESVHAMNRPIKVGSTANQFPTIPGKKLL